MPYNGAGSFSVYTPGTPFVTGTVISSTVANSVNSDFATGLSNAICKDGQSVPTANIPLGGNKITGLAAAAVNGDAVRFEQIAPLTGANSTITSMTGLTAPTVAANPMRAQDEQIQLVTAFTTAGTATAFTLTPTPAITANAANQRFRVKFNAAAGATPTLAVSGQATLNLKYYDSTGTKQAITATQVPINWVSDVSNDGTDWVVLQTVPPVQKFSAVSAISGNTVLTTAAYGQYYYTSGTTQITLPVSAAADVGKSITFYCYTTGVISFQTQSSQTLYAQGVGATLPAVLMNVGDSITIVCFDATGFMVVSASNNIGVAQTWQTVTRNSGTTYYNTTGKPITLFYTYGNTSTVFTIAALAFQTLAAGVGTTQGTTLIIPPGASYSYTGTLAVAYELR
jgi:hypothetical protein